MSPSGQAITNNVLVTHEILHYLKLSKVSKRGSMAIKTNMNKIYNRIEWGFLEAVPMRFGFAPTWINWLLECVTTVVLFLSQWFTSRQAQTNERIKTRDPLSPYLFIFCTEVLSDFCRKAQENGSMPGIRVARNSMCVNHLIFADDFFFFFNVEWIWRVVKLWWESYQVMRK